MSPPPQHTQRAAAADSAAKLLIRRPLLLQTQGASLHAAALSGNLLQATLLQEASCAAGQTAELQECA